MKWTYWLWHYFTTISGHFFANYINIFHKTEVPTNILRCQLCLNLNLGQSISDVVKFSRFQTPTPLCWQSFKYYSLANLANFDPTPLRNDDVLNGWSLCWKTIGHKTQFVLIPFFQYIFWTISNKIDHCVGLDYMIFLFVPA